jgi:Lrp/AsnC family leucine-responsive transcriptional regulator
LKTAELDEIDRRIIRILQEDGRASVKAIAKKVGRLSKVAISYRMKRLRNAGIIEGYYAKINPNSVKQGFLFVVGLSFYPKGKEQNPIVKRVAALDGVQSVFQTFGEYDALVIGRAADAVFARDLIFRICQIGGVRNSTTYVTHTVVKHSLELTV